MGSEDTDLESIVLRVANLEISVSVRVVEPGIYARDSLNLEVASPPRSQPAPSSAAGSAARREATPEGFAFPESLEELCIRATTAAECAALPLDFLASFTTRLRASGRSEWTPWARIGRAFRAGILAARRFDGEYRDEVSPGLPHYRNTFYICLRGARGGAPFWTNNYASYVARTRDSVGGRDFDDSAISHAFPTRAEVSAYLAGARQGWPQEI